MTIRQNYPHHCQGMTWVTWELRSFVPWRGGWRALRGGSILWIFYSTATCINYSPQRSKNVCLWFSSTRVYVCFMYITLIVRFKLQTFTKLHLTHMVYRLQGEGYTLIWGVDPNQPSQGARCHLLLWLKQGYPPSQSARMLARCHPLGAWLVEQNALPSQLVTKQLWFSAMLKGPSVMTGIRTHTLLLTTPGLLSGEL